MLLIIFSMAHVEVPLEALEKAVRRLKLFYHYQRGETLTDGEIKECEEHRPVYDAVDAKIRPLMEACENSTRSIDYSIIVF